MMANILTVALLPNNIFFKNGTTMLNNNNRITFHRCHRGNPEIKKKKFYFILKYQKSSATQTSWVEGQMYQCRSLQYYFELNYNKIENNRNYCSVITPIFLIIKEITGKITKMASPMGSYQPSKILQ